MEVTSDPKDSVTLVASSAHSKLVAVATRQGGLSTWDVSGSLCIMVSPVDNDVCRKLTPFSAQLKTCSIPALIEIE